MTVEEYLTNIDFDNICYFEKTDQTTKPRPLPKNRNITLILHDLKQEKNKVSLRSEPINAVSWKDQAKEILS